MRYLFLLWVVTSLGCAVNPVTGRQEFVLMSEQQELALGQQANKQVLQQYKVYPDQQLQSYVNSVGQALAGKSHRTNLSYTFTVVDSTEINAFALPGGYIYITRGLLTYLNSEAELAAVLGHEIGHVTARHSVRQQTSAQAASLGAGLLSVLLPQMASNGLGQTVNMLGTALLRGYGREHELEADRLGADYLAKTGYDPEAMLAVISTLKRQQQFDQQLARLEGREARSYHGVFSTHPDHDTRLREIVEYAQTQQTTADGIFRNRYLDEIDGMIFGPNPADGVVVDNRFYHPELGFAVQFPRGWGVANQPQQVVAMNSQRTAQLQLSARPVQAGTRAEQVLANLGIQDFRAPERIGNRGVDGVTGIAVINTQNGQRAVRLSVMVIRRHAYLLAGIARSADQQANFDRTFKSVAASFTQLSNADRSQLHGQRLRVAKLQGPVSWKNLARSSPLKKLPEAHLRLINAAAPSASIPQTTRIKVVE